MSDGAKLVVLTQVTPQVLSCETPFKCQDAHADELTRPGARARAALAGGAGVPAACVSVTYPSTDDRELPWSVVACMNCMREASLGAVGLTLLHCSCTAPAATKPFSTLVRSAFLVRHYSRVTFTASTKTALRKSFCFASKTAQNALGVGAFDPLAGGDSCGAWISDYGRAGCRCGRRLVESARKEHRIGRWRRWG